jgi:hypothetical protein
MELLKQLFGNGNKGDIGDIEDNNKKREKGFDVFKKQKEKSAENPEQGASDIPSAKPGKNPDAGNKNNGDMKKMDTIIDGKPVNEKVEEAKRRYERVRRGAKIVKGAAITTGHLNLALMLGNTQVEQSVLSLAQQLQGGGGQQYPQAQQNVGQDAMREIVKSIDRVVERSWQNKEREEKEASLETPNKETPNKKE